MTQVNPISTARFKLAYERPYLATAIWALNPIPTEGLKTLAVDKYWRLYYDPKISEQWTIDEIISVMYHEVCHLLRDHPARGETYEKTLANIAADCEINDDIVEENAWQLPQGVCLPSTFGLEDGKLMEAYYQELLKQAEKNKGKKPGPGDIIINMPGGGNCGSAAHGQSEDYEKGKPSDGDGIGKAEGNLMRRQVAKEIQDASKSRGTVPGHLARWADTELSEKIDWRKQLATCIRQVIAKTSGAKDYTYHKPSRRSGKDIILPSTFQPVPNIAVVIDTSGSMGSKQVEQAVAEIGGILKNSGARDGVTVLTVDAAVHATKKVFKKEKVVLEGGGGTDMTLGIEGAAKLKPRPDICVVLTDGYTPWPENQPRGMHTIICLIHSFPETPAWAKRIEVRD